MKKIMVAIGLIFALALGSGLGYFVGNYLFPVTAPGDNIQVEEMKSEMSEIQKRVEICEGKDGEISAKLVVVDERLDKIEQDKEETLNKITALENSLTALRTELTEKMTELENKVNAGGNQEEIEQLQAQVTALQQEITNKEQELATLRSESQAQIDALLAEKEELIAQRDALQAEHTEIRATITELNTKFTTLENRIAQLENASNVAVSNSNLLINGDFRINQRGVNIYKNDYTTPDKYSYSVDRWSISGGNSQMVFETATNKVTNGGSSTGYLIQKIEEKNVQPLLGKTVTLSAKLKNNSQIYSLVVNMPNVMPTEFVAIGGNCQIEDKANMRLFYYSDVKALGFTFDIFANSTIELEYAKFEYGSIATAYTARPYGEELALCQRYYWKNNVLGSGYNQIGIGFCINETRVDVTVVCPNQMRVLPKVIYSNLEFYKTSTKLITKVEATRINGGALTLQCTSSGLTKGDVGLVRNGNVVAYMEFDAEIY